MKETTVRLSFRLRSFTNMKTKIISAVVLGFFVLGTTLQAQGPLGAGASSTKVIEAKPITKAEAEKKYPAPKSGYPVGERDPHDPAGIVLSPYPPHTRMD